nr:putative internal protein A [uncultured Mediterranean phage uvMED]
MSWIGNVIAAVGAFKAGKYNKELFDKQAQLNRNQIERKKAVYNKIDKPRLLKNQKSAYSEFFVNLLRSGAEFRPGTTTFFTAQAFKVNQATDLAIADYNLSTDLTDMENQSLLLEAKGDQAMMQGVLTAASEGAKAASKMKSNNKDGGSLLG